MNAAESSYPVAAEWRDKFLAAEAREAELQQEVERLTEEKNKADHWFASSEKILGKLVWQIEKVADHFDEFGNIKGEGKWRLIEIGHCILAMVQSLRDGNFEKLEEVRSLGKENAELEAEVERLRDQRQRLVDQIKQLCEWHADFPLIIEEELVLLEAAEEGRMSDGD